MLIIGLTGGIASGKSTVAKFFSEFGVPVVDADELARLAVLPGTAALQKIRESFGARIITADGDLDRKALREEVFRDESLRRQLEMIIHPEVRRLAAEKFASLENTQNPPYCLYVAPLLIESGLHKAVQRVLVVDCEPELQRRRLLARDACSPAQADAILAAQADRQSRLAIADDVIYNHGDLTNLRAQVETLHCQYLQLAQNSDL